MSNNEKIVKQTTLKRNFYLIIYNYLKSGKSIQDVIYDYNISKQNLQYYINRLKEAQIIKKIGFATWIIINKLDPKKVKVRVKQTTQDGMSKTKILSDEIRAHGFMYKLRIPKITKWNKRQVYMDKYNIKYDLIHSNGQKIIVNGKIVHLFTNSIIVYDKFSYISMLANESKSLAIYKFKCIIKRIERMFKVNLKINKGYKFKVLKEHYGLVKNSLARQYNEEGKKLHVYNSEGLWLVIDNSFNLHELEIQKNRCPDENQTVKDTNNIQDFFNDLKLNPEFKASMVIKGMAQLMELHYTYGKNMETHISAIEKLGSGVEELTKIIKKMQKFK